MNEKGQNISQNILELVTQDILKSFENILEGSQYSRIYNDVLK